MLLRVGEAERRAPAVAVDEPTLDAELLAQALDVGHEVLSRVRLQTGTRVAGVRSAASAASLVEEAAVTRRAAAARSSVQDHGWLPFGVATRFPINRIALADVEHPVLVRF